MMRLVFLSVILSTSVFGQKSNYTNDLYFIHLDRTTNYPVVIIDSSENHFICKLKETNAEVGFYYHYGDCGYWNSKADTFRLDDHRGIVFINPYPDVFLKLTEHDKNQNFPSNVGISGFLERYALGLAEKCVSISPEGTVKFYFDDKGFIIQKQVIKNGVVVKDEYY